VKESGIVIEDLNSTNGLRVNNEFITGTLDINLGDHIRIGQTVFLVSDRPLEVEPGEEDESTSSALLRKQKKYENLLQKTAFQVTKTTTLRKLKSEKEGRDTGFLSFFESNDS
jgi:pSer/pThr/pTyr-binding forkhead associated (FHA) protein